MSKILFEKLTVEEEKKVRAGTDESDVPMPDFCEPTDGAPPDKPCLPGD